MLGHRCAPALSNLERLSATGARRAPPPSPSRSRRTSCSATSCRSSRKIKEAILALRIEQAFTKDQILELYLNEIFLGDRSYGVAAAALNYFDKSLDELTHRRGGLPGRPAQGALVLRPVAQPRGRAAAAQLRDRPDAGGRLHHARPRPTRPGPSRSWSRDASGGRDVARRRFFIEEVRRQLVGQLRRGRASTRAASRSRTTVEPRLQALADRALRHGLAAYDRRQRPLARPLGPLSTRRWPAAGQAALEAK